MGKVTHDVGSDSSDDERKKTVREERKIRTKKRKRKKDLTDLHQKLFKSKKQNRKPNKFWQSNFVKLLHHFADIREEYSKETKINGKLEKARNSKRISNRILPRPLSGIYRNGAAGKEIRRSQTILPMNDTDNARLQGNVLKLVQGYNSKAKSIIVESNIEGNYKEPSLDSAIKNILHPTPPGKECLSPVLGKVDGKKRGHRNDYIETVGPSKYIGFLQKSPEKKKVRNPERFRYSAIARYQELCATVSSENFEGYNALDQFTADPLIVVKKKLRNFYAESFRNQFLRDMVKRGTNECKSSRVSLENDIPSEIQYCPSGFGEDTETASEINENAKCQIRNRNNGKENNSRESHNSFLVPEAGFGLNGKRNLLPTSHLLFDLSMVKGSNNYTNVENIESEQIKRLNDIESDDDLTDINKHIYSSLEVNYSNTSTGKNLNTKYSDDVIATCLNRTEKAEEQVRSKSVLFFPNEIEISNGITAKKRLVKSKNQHTQTMHSLNTAMKRHSGRHALKAPQQVKVKSLKHVPAILRRRNITVTNNDRMNIFGESTNIDEELQETLPHSKSKENVLFTPRSLITKLNGNTKRLETLTAANAILNNVGAEDIDMQACVIASPSLHNDEVQFIKKSRLQMDTKQQPQNVNINNILPHNSKKCANPLVQKTIMFTKKDSRNIGHCLHINNLISDGTTDSSNICVMKKSLPQQHEKSTRNICIAHRNCQRASANCYRACHCSQNSDISNHSSQEFEDPSVSQLKTAQMQEEPVAYEKVLLRRVHHRPKYENNQKCHNKNEKVCYVVLDQCKDINSPPNCTVNNRPTKMEHPRPLQNRRCCQEYIGEVGILKGVQNLQILPVEEREPQVSFTNSQCTRNTVLLEEQPIKYMAFENDSKAHRIPIYVQNNHHVTTVDNMELISPKRNYHVVSCPKESDQKIILVPAREQNNVVYLKQENLNHSSISYERHSRPKKVVFYRQEHQSNTQCVKDSSNLCEIHVPKKNLIGIRNTERERVAINLQKADEVKQLKRDSINWEELHYRSSHEHPLVNDAYVRSQAVFYKK